MGDLSVPQIKEEAMSYINPVSEIPSSNQAKVNRLHSSRFFTLTSPKTEELRARYEALHAGKNSTTTDLKKT